MRRIMLTFTAVLFFVALLLPARAAPVSAAPLNWHSAGSMALPRLAATTRLADGRVLITGGQDFPNIYASAELYDPQTNQWSPGGWMSTPRVYHTATLLKDGRVLVAGGTGSLTKAAVVASAEIYNPATGQWTSTGAMHTPREGHSATLLKDGRVLVAGGDNGNATALDSAEIFDPAAGLWYSVKSMNHASYLLSSVLLPDGRVLAVGGSNATYQRLVEIYDPVADQWILAPSMLTPRDFPTVTLLPTGRVLVAGGLWTDGSSYIAQSSTEVYDPYSNQWHAAGSLAIARHEHQAVGLADGRVFVFGGITNPNDYEFIRQTEVFDPYTETWSRAAATEMSGELNATLLADERVLLTSRDPRHSAELYDPAERQWRENAQAMNEGRGGHATVRLTDGSLLVSGGYKSIGYGDARTVLSSIEKFNPEANEFNNWLKVGSLTTPRRNHTMTLLPDGRVMVIGGLGQDGGGLANVEFLFSPAGSSNSGSPTARPHWNHTADLISGERVLVVGGPESSNGYEIYDAQQNAWTQPAPDDASVPLLAGLSEHASLVLADGRVMIIGGKQGQAAVSQVLLFDPQQNHWSQTGSLSRPRAGMTATLLPDGRVLVTGGWETTGAALPTAEIYQPETGQWSTVNSMNFPRLGHTATLLPNGEVLVTGGQNPLATAGHYPGDSFGYLASTEIYNPSSGEWRLTGSMIKPRAGHTATLLPDGRVLVAGGWGDFKEENVFKEVSLTELFKDSRVLYVDDSARGANNGASWANAYTDLQAALGAARMGDQIWVAEGTYYPTTSPTDRSASFVLREKVGIYGGFAGNETSLAQRSWMAHPSILSGDIDHGQPVASGHSYHVVYSTAANEQRVAMDGFTITAGQADGPLGTDGSAANRQGGGIYNHGPQPVLRNLLIIGNTAEQGGGMYTDIFARLVNVTFRDNSAVYGGGLANGDHPVRDTSHFQSQAVLTNVTFSHNSADYGGAIANRGADGVHLPPDDTIPVVTHGTFNDNIARVAGSAIYSVGVQYAKIDQSIIWGAGPTSLISADADSDFLYDHSIIQNGCPAGATCANVSNADPQLGAFGSVSSSPYTYPLSATSPAIDAAPLEICARFLNTGTFTYKTVPLETDQRGAPRPSGASCDLGAHEYQYQGVLSILSGDDQRTDAFTPFPDPLVVGVSSAWGEPVDGLIIHFTGFMTNSGGYVSSSTAVVSGGQASVTAEASAAPGFGVQASAPGYNPVVFHMNVNDTIVTLTVSPNPAVDGQPVTLTATVTGQLPDQLGQQDGQPAPGGRVRFNADGSTLAEVILPGLDLFGGPSVTTQVNLNFRPGTYTLVAEYIPNSLTYHDNTFSPPVLLQVYRPNATVSLGGLAQVYNGTPRAVTVSTNPANLSVRVTYNGSTNPPVKAGSYTVLAEITEPGYSGFSSGKLEVSKAVLHVQAKMASRYYGQPNPPLDYTISGYVEGDGPEDIQGSPVLSCNALPTSPASSYTIQVDQGTLAAENYQFDLSYHKLYVSAAPTRIQLTPSSSQPVFGQPISLLAQVFGPDGSVVTPSGSLTFSIDGSPVSTTALNTDAQATFTTSSLAVGTHSIQAQFAANDNYQGSSTTTSLKVTPPRGEHHAQ